MQLTRKQLLSPAGFGYGGDYSSSEPNPWARSYIGLARRRNMWHDGWVALALLRAGAQEAEVKSLLTQLVGIYGAPDGTMFHWGVEERRREDNVRYCGDNALFYAICSDLMWAPAAEGKETGDETSAIQHKINHKKSQKAFWDFVDELREGDEDGLASVGDVYKQVRLHPNSELAALLLWRLV
jgi:hypothetical protein